MITQPALVWYVSYGSNMCADRLRCYLAGGVPAGARHGYSGCRDRRAPLRATGCRIGSYLAGLPGARGHWAAADIAALQPP